MELEPAEGVADSGYLMQDLPAMIHALGEAAQEAGRCVVFLIDELQYLDSDEMSALVMAKHRVNQWRLPVVLAGAGLPQLPALTSDAQTCAERMFNWVRVGRLEAMHAAQALVLPARAEGVEYTPEAIDSSLDWLGRTAACEEGGHRCASPGTGRLHRAAFRPIRDFDRYVRRRLV